MNAGQTDADVRIRRLRMRCWRRGTREMDLILGPFADARASAMPEEVLVNLEALLSENDHDLYAWVSGRSTVPDPYAALVSDLRSFHDIS